MPVIKAQRRHAALLALAVRGVMGSGVCCASVVLASAVMMAAPAVGQTARPTSPPPGAPGNNGGLPPVLERTTGPVSLEGVPILRVEVVGNTRTDTQLILDQVRAQAGQKYSSALVDVDQRAVAALDKFLTAQAVVDPVEDPTTHLLKGVIVRFVVEERPVVAAVEIVGNRLFSDSTLRDGLLLQPGSSYDLFNRQTDVKTILDMYHKKGYAQAAVDVDNAALQKGIVRYTITEGPRSTISLVKIEGNDNVPGSYIRFKIESKSSWWIFRKGLLDEDKLQRDLTTIRDIYLKRGYIDARVSSSLDYSEDKSKLTLRFTVIEGPRYKVGKIVMAGNKVFGVNELLGDMGHFGPGSFAERDKMDALQKRVEDRYGEEGYIDRNVTVRPVYTDVPGIVDLNINVEEGSPYVVGRIIVRGNGGIQDRVVRRQVRIYPDQTFDMVLVKKSIERLKAIRIFSDVKITPIDSPGNPAGVKDALVEVGEGQTGRFLVGAGVSTNSGLIGQISLEQQNFDISNPPHTMGEFLRGQAFKGAGQYFRILLEPGTEFQRYRITFEEPYLFDTPYSFNNDIYYFTRGRESWNERRIGDVVTFGRRFGDVWGVSVALRAEQVSITSPSDQNNNGITDSGYFLTSPSTGEPVGPFTDSAQQILDAKGGHFLTSIKPGVVRDTTDSRIFPTTGTRTSLAWEQYGAIGGDYTFSKISGRFDWYVPLIEDIFERKTVFSLRNQFGINTGGQSPFFERFYGGGIGDLRGFKFRGVGPVSGPRHDPIGGDFSWVTTAEVNFPVYENLLRGVVFTDVGDYETNIDIGTIRADIGAGVRVTIPFFGQLPLALDFAVPVQKQSTDHTEFISFSLGIPF